ncbi:hypothetical protein ACQPWW_09765 [Micromonospora sp. CA-240977]|uniref:WD40 repeat domain-containing protein n=1 Tax=Micromonospora sp. CA-240977 TaxID=3239957 RepID=UPI003D8EE577
MTSESDDAQLREKMRAAVAGLARRGGILKRSSGPYLVSLLCATSLVPVVAAGLTNTSVGLAISAGLGSVGANVLTNVVSQAIEHFRGAEPDEFSAEAIERKLIVLLEEVLVDDGGQANVARAEIAELLKRIDAVGALVEAGDAELRDGVVETLALLASQFGEFRFVVAEARQALWRVESSLRRQEELQRVGLERVADQQVTLRLVLEKVSAVEARSSADPGASVRAPPWTGCPYRGLSPFEERHSAVFYGRAEATSRLVQQLAVRLAHGQMLFLVGASGAGKSSLLRAGLIPRLAGDRLVPASAAWPRRVMTPTGNPLEELAAHLADLAGTDAAAVHRSLVADPSSARLLALQATRGDASGGGGVIPERLVLIVDQFEELFTLVADDPAGRRIQLAFVAALHAMAAVRHTGDLPAAVLVVAVRADFLDRAAAYPELREALQSGSFLLGPMTEVELRLAICGPAAEAGVSLERGLAEAILGELRDRTLVTGFDAGVLPLLSQAMLALWESRDGGPLTVRAYWRMGGLGQAVQSTAESVYQALPASRREVARSVFVQLTVVTGSGQLACRRATREELAVATGVAPEDLDTVLAPFADRRLIVLERHTVRIAHDALLLGWARLRGWLDAEQADRTLYRELAEDASLWARRGRDPSFLYRGSQLGSAVQAAERWNAKENRFPPAAPGTQEFLAASKRAADRNVWLRRAVTAALAALTIAALVAAGLATNRQADLRRQQAVALSRQLAAQSQVTRQHDPLLAGRLAAAAWRMAPTDEAFASMRMLVAEPRSVLYGHTASVNDVTFSPRGQLLASAGGDATVRLWDPLTGLPIGRPLVGHEGKVSRVAFNADGSLLASASDDGTVRLWDPATGRPVGGPLTGQEGPVTAVAFHPRDRLLASAGDDGTVRFWNPGTGSPVGQPLTTGSGAVTAVAFSPDGQLLAAASRSADGHGVIQLWDPATRRTVGKPLKGHADWIWSLAFSRDGRLASAGLDGSVRLWEPSTGAVGPVLSGSGSKVTGVAFTPDGTRLASTGADRTIRLWNAADGKPIGSPLTGHRDWVWSVAFSPRGQLMATGGSDGTVRLWDAASGQPVTRSTGITRGYLSDVAFNPDGSVVATANGNDRTIGLWNPATGRPLGKPIAAQQQDVTAVAFSPRDPILASGGSDGSIRLWNPTTGRPLGRPLTGHRKVVTALAFNRDGTLLASSADEQAVRLWDPATGQPVGDPLTGHPGAVNTLSFSDDLLATGGDDGTVRLWNLATGQAVGDPLTGHSGPVTVVRFSPDGHLLAAGGEDGTIRVWNPATGRQMSTMIDEGAVSALDFSPDGSVLASGGAQSDAVRVWDPAGGRQIGRPVSVAAELTSAIGVSAVAFSPTGTIIAHVSMRGLSITDRAVVVDTFGTVCALYGSLTSDEWKTYIRGRPFATVCP